MVDDKCGMGGTRMCAFAFGAFGAAYGVFGMYVWWVGIDEIGLLVWMWVELMLMVIGKVFGVMWVLLGMCYFACVNAETFAEMFMIGMLLGVYVMCVGIDSYYGWKNK